MAIDFPATTDRYEGTGAAATAYPVSIACWFKADTLTAARTLVCLGSSGSANQFVEIAATSSGVVARSETGGVVATATSTTSPATGTWHHAAGVFASSTDRRAYIDGGSKGTDTTSNAWPAFANRTLIAQRRRNGVYSLGMDGVVAEAAIWAVELTDDDVYSLAQGASPLLVRSDDLVFYSPMSREMIDVVGSKAMTATGSPAVARHPRIYQ